MEFIQDCTFFIKSISLKTMIMKKALLFITLAMVLLQGSFARTVRGFVTDNGGNALPGVTILLKGTSTGVSF